MFLLTLEKIIFLKFTPFEQGDLGFWGLCIQNPHSLG